MADSIEAYTIADNNVERLGEERRSDLDQLLKDIARGIESSGTMINGLNWFAHGWLHSQLQNEIGSQDVVDTIIIGDDFVDVRTHVGRPHFSMQARFEDMEAHHWAANYPGDWFGDEEFKIKIHSYYLLLNNQSKLPQKKYKISTGENTGWYQGPVGILGQTAYPSEWSIQADIHESDPIVNIEDWTAYHDVILDEATVQQAHAMGNYGVITEVVQDASQDTSLVGG